MAKMADYLKNIFFIILILQFAPPLIKSVFKQYSNMIIPKTKVAYIPIKGILYSAQGTIRHLKKYFENDEIKAILLGVESPGGAAGTGEAIANEISILKRKHPKPIITLTENICTSAAYYIAVTTDYIVAPPSALVGSVGTSIPYQFQIKELLEKYNVKYIPIATGKYKNATNPFVEMTDDEKQLLEGLTQDSYQNFIEHVAKNRRSLRLEKASTWADGKIMTGRQAKKIGLIDEVGSQTNAINKIKKAALIEEEIEWIKPKQPTSFLSLFSADQNADTTQLSTIMIKKFIQHLHTNSLEKTLQQTIQ